MVKSQNPNWSAEGIELAIQNLTGTLQSFKMESPTDIITDMQKRIDTTRDITALASYSIMSCTGG
jgi:hypothetical protein